MKTLNYSKIAIGFIISGIVGIIYCIIDYEYKIYNQSHIWNSCLAGSSCPLPAGVFDFSITDNLSISLILPISVVILCIGIIKIRK